MIFKKYNPSYVQEVRRRIMEIILLHYLKILIYENVKNQIR